MKNTATTTATTFFRLPVVLISVLACGLFANCSYSDLQIRNPFVAENSGYSARGNNPDITLKAPGLGSGVVISVHDQHLAHYIDGKCVAHFPVSTSKFGVGDTRGSYRTPVGMMKVSEKIGEGAPTGAVFKGRVRTGEVVKPDSPGRDPIVTRILRVKGLDSSNQNAHRRCIYIHGTPEERNIGRPVSYGCIRMVSNDIVRLYDSVDVGTQIMVTTDPLSKAVDAIVAKAGSSKWEAGSIALSDEAEDSEVERDRERVMRAYVRFGRTRS